MQIEGALGHHKSLRVTAARAWGNRTYFYGYYGNNKLSESSPIRWNCNCRNQIHEGGRLPRLGNGARSVSMLPRSGPPTISGKELCYYSFQCLGSTPVCTGIYESILTVALPTYGTPSQVDFQFTSGEVIEKTPAPSSSCSQASQGPTSPMWRRFWAHARKRRLQ